MDQIPPPIPTFIMSDSSMKDSFRNLVYTLFSRPQEFNDIPSDSPFSDYIRKRGDIFIKIFDVIFEEQDKSNDYEKVWMTSVKKIIALGSQDIEVLRFFFESFFDPSMIYRDLNEEEKRIYNLLKCYKKGYSPYMEKIWNFIKKEVLTIHLERMIAIRKIQRSFTKQYYAPYKTGYRKSKDEFISTYLTGTLFK